MIKLCNTNDIAPNTAKEFSAAKEYRLFVVQHEGRFYGYQNNCPHAGLPLNLSPNAFLDIDKNYIQCANHMALFNIADGICIDGPCHGDSLKHIELIEKNGALWIETIDG